MAQKFKSIIRIPMILSIGFVFSCKKKEEAVTCQAGAGGSISFHAALFHHTTLIPNDSLRPDTVWVKYCQTGWNDDPSTYDARFIGIPGEDSVHVTGLKPGQYFFRGSGYDRSIFLEVSGGVAASCDGSSNHISINIPVTEH